MQLSPPSPAGVPRRGARLLAAALALPGLGAQADSAPDAATVAVKVLDYRERQPGADRVKVVAPAVSLVMPVGSRWSLAATALSDSISGASPAYHTSGLSALTDHRKAAELSVSRYFDDATLTVGTTYSTEADYTSRGLSLQGSLSSDDRNTTWTAGLAASSDRINPTNRVVENEHKRVHEVLAGVTQVLGEHDVVQVTAGYSRGRGYFSDPYKVFDHRPRERDHRRLLLRWNHHFAGTGDTLRSSWRWYGDNYGIRSHTLAFEYVHPLPAGWTVTPLARLYTQSAARFYLPADPSSEPFPPNPPADAEHYTQDQRMSAFGAVTVGVKVAVRIGADWLADLKVERYSQRGAWRWFGTGSTDLQPFDTRSIQVGLSRRF